MAHRSDNQDSPQPISRLDKFARTLCSCALGTALTISAASADDTEVFFGQVDDDLNIYPNVLFVLDTSGSMHWGDTGQVGSRLERMKEALTTILENSTNVNVGLMRMNGLNGGGSVIYPISPIDEVICGDSDACGDVAILAKVKADNDDAEERLNNNNMSLDGNYISMSKQTSSSTEQTVAYRFRDLMIPQGADIKSAKLQFTAAFSDTTASSLSIQGEDVDDSAVFSNSAGDITNRLSDDSTAAVVPWSPGNWNQSQQYQSPDITDVIQEIVDRDGWCGGNALSIIIDGTGQRSAYSYDSGANVATALNITYDASNIPATGGCTEKTVIAQVAKSSDDATELVYPYSYTYDKRMYITADDLWTPRFGQDGLELRTGLRFENILVPQGAEIKHAEMQLVMQTPYDGTGTTTIRVEDSSHADTFVGTRGNISNRSKRADSINWDIPEAQISGTKIYTSDIKDLVQGVVDKPTWANGNNGIALFIEKGTGDGAHFYKSFDRDPSAAAKLRVTYRANLGATQITARDEMFETINNMTATGGTPIIASYLEAANYYLGNPVDYGMSRGKNNVDYQYWSNSSNTWKWALDTDQRSRYHRVSHPSSHTGGGRTADSRCVDGNMDASYCKPEVLTGNPVYKSPLANSCQTNHIVFLSDGAPTSNTASSKIMGLTGESSCDENGNEECGVELAEWLYTNDHNPLLKNDQTVSTYTIGFNLSSPFLESLAVNGGGQYFQAASAQDLTKVFDEILSNVLSVDTSFVAPGATVNQFNRLTHDKNIYFALFQPNKRPTWEGNIKRYQVKSINGQVEIVDKNDDNAVDSEFGFFKKDSQSLWSAAKDGHSVGAGGAAEHIKLTYQLGTGDRRVFTYTGDESTLYGNTTQADLTAGAHALNENNNNISDSDLGVQNVGSTTAERVAYRNSLLKWARGVDVLDDDKDGDISEARQHMGDPMHSRPVILNYANSANASGADTTIFVSTNEGFLHALDQDSGKELFGFMPKELLGNLVPYFENQVSASRPYGLDGAISVWTNDDNGNVVIDNNEKAFIYVGMRRGGNNYYALDVTDRANPKLAWVIKGGTGGTPGFENMGQSWSRMVPNRVMINGVERNVLTFAAGYDTNQDAQDGDPARTTDDSGRGIFMVDALTGEKVWSGGGISGEYDTHFSDMTFSIPGAIRVVDIDTDGLSDQLYVGDMGGQLWRFDIAKYHNSSSVPFVSGGVVADISGSGTAGERRFFSEPDVALISRDGDRFLTVSIGSGWRAHPLDEAVEDRFYVFRSNNVYQAPEGYGKPNTAGTAYSALTESDLLDVTNSLEASNNPYGWYLRMEKEGEKVLGSSITINNQVVFTSYRPDPEVEACSTAIGEGVVYAVNVLGGMPTMDKDDDGDDKEDRITELKHGGIPPEATALITEDGPIILVGAEQPLRDLDFSNLTQRSFWLDSGRSGRKNNYASSESSSD